MDRENQVSCVSQWASWLLIMRCDRTWYLEEHCIITSSTGRGRCWSGSPDTQRSITWSLKAAVSRQPSGRSRTREKSGQTGMKQATPISCNNIPPIYQSTPWAVYAAWRVRKRSPPWHPRWPCQDTEDGKDHRSDLYYVSGGSQHSVAHLWTTGRQLFQKEQNVLWSFHI